MNGVPNIYTPYQLDKLCVSRPSKIPAPEAGLPDGRWVKARPLPYPGLRLLTRLKRAWMVFTGQADVLLWEG
jgi:hypothetical protein